MAGSNWMFCPMVTGSLLQSSYCQVWGGTHTKGNPGHPIVLDGFLWYRPPDEPVQISVSWCQLYFPMHFGNIRCESHWVGPELDQDAAKCGMQSWPNLEQLVQRHSCRCGSTPVKHNPDVLLCLETECMGR